MRYGILITLVTALLVLQERPQPPEGWFCSHEATDDHKCECQRSCSPKLDCDEEGNCTLSPDGGVQVNEDVKCKVYCHKDHCGCPVKGCEHT